MNLISFFHDLFHSKPKGKMIVPPKKSETTQEAAARALDRFFSSNRNGRK
jgi:hypothetical protein